MGRGLGRDSAHTAREASRYGSQVVRQAGRAGRAVCGEWLGGMVAHCARPKNCAGGVSKASCPPHLRAQLVRHGVADAQERVGKRHACRALQPGETDEVGLPPATFTLGPGLWRAGFRLAAAQIQLQRVYCSDQAHLPWWQQSARAREPQSRWGRCCAEGRPMREDVLLSDEGG